MISRATFSRSWRFFRSAKGSFALTVGALACGVALVAAIELVEKAVFRAFAETIDTAAGRAALQVTMEGEGLFPEEVKSLVDRVPGVEFSVAVLTGTAVTVDGPPELLTLHAFDILDEKALRVYGAGEGRVLEDALEFLNTAEAIIVTRAFAERRGLEHDQEIRLDTPTGRHAFRIGGIWEAAGIARAYGGNLIVQDILQAQEMFGRPGMIDRIDVVVDRGADPEEVAERLRKVLPSGLVVGTPEQRKANLHAALRSMHLVLRAVGLLALAAAFLIAFHRVGAVYERRTWDLAVLRSLGARRSVLRADLLLESSLVGVAGTVLGVALGVGLGHLVLPVVARTTALNYRTLVPDAHLVPDPAALLLPSVLGLGTAILAALLPARRAARVSIAETLRWRWTERPEERGKAASYLSAALGAATFGCFALQNATKNPVWGLAATVLSVVLVKALATPLLQGALALSRTAATEFGFAARAVLRNVSRAPRRSTLVTSMVAIGLGAALWIGLVAHSFERTVVAVFRQSMQADLVVSSAHIGTGALEVPIDGRVAHELRRVPGVASVVGIRLANWKHAGGPVVLDAFDPEYFTSPEFGEWPLHGARLAGAWDAVARGEAVVVSTNFLANVGGEVGDFVELTTPSGPLRLRIAGVTTDFASPRGTIEMSRSLYERYWNDPTVTRFFVDVAPGADPAEVRAAILDRLGGRYTLRILSGRDLVDYWASQVRQAFAGVFVLAAVILVVVTLGIGDNVAAGVFERTRELSILRALGARPRRVGRLVVAETVFLALAGIALGLALAFLLARVWIGATLPLLLGWRIDFHVPAFLVFGVASVGLVSATLAATWPARHAPRLSPAAALRWE